jgi:uncharacterized MAPEG superfamily protein
MEARMTTELFYLLFTAILTGILWIPVVVGKVLARGPLKPSDYKVEPTSPLPNWVNRANRAQMNAAENLAPFAAVVLIAHAVGVSTSITEISAAVYFYARTAHAVIHTTGFSLFRARTVLFTVAWVAFVVFAIDLLRHTI